MKDRSLSRHQLALKLRTMYDRDLAQHVLVSQHVVDAGRAIFRIGKPGTGIFAAEIGALSFGTVYVNGDVDAVVFGTCSYRTWQQKLTWLSGNNYDYAEEKASIGSSCSEMARGFDEAVARRDVLEWRRRDYIDADAAREVMSLIGDGDYQGAQNELYRRTGDCELYLGKCTAPRVIMAQACITKLCELLKAAGSLEAA